MVYAIAKAAAPQNGVELRGYIHGRQGAETRVENMPDFLNHNLWNKLSSINMFLPP